MLDIRDENLTLYCSKYFNWRIDKVIFQDYPKYTQTKDTTFPQSEHPAEYSRIPDVVEEVVKWVIKYHWRTSWDKRYAVEFFGNDHHHRLSGSIEDKSEDVENRIWICLFCY